MSAQRQTGALSVATTDDNGNLAFDGGAIFTEIANNRQGVAIALATQIPDLVAGEGGAFAINFGRFKDANAFSLGGAAVVYRDRYQPGDRITVNGALGANLGRSEFFTRKGDTVFGGRVGLQYSWQ
ncbi:MAG: hypothetical protein GY742_12725 [Hyphomicrobiales bacterium]|nr:hypothetical protein [Hyphomicrobiales bacterium]